MKFSKIVAVDITGLIEAVQKQLHGLADEVILHEDFPTGNREILARIGDADCLLISWNTPIDREVIEGVKSLKYIGMCCSLYDEKSANVDIQAARQRGIQVLRGSETMGMKGLWSLSSVN